MNTPAPQPTHIPGLLEDIHLATQAREQQRQAELLAELKRLADDVASVRLEAAQRQHAAEMEKQRAKEHAEALQQIALETASRNKLSARVKRWLKGDFK